MLLIEEKAIRVGICHTVHWYLKANNKYKKEYEKNKESLYFKCIGTLKICMGQQGGFEWVEETSNFNEDF